MKKVVYAAIAVVFIAGTIITAQSTQPETQPTSKPVTPPKVKIKLGKDTTRITEPLTKDGLPDYVAAINQQYSKGVTKENNAAVLLVEVLGPAFIGKPVREQFLKQLGVTLPENGKYLESPESAIAKESFDTAQDGPWESRNHGELVKWLDANKVLLDKAVEASKRKRYYTPMVTAKPDDMYCVILLPSITQFRMVARALIVRANLAVTEKRFDDARKDILAVYRLSALLDTDATTIGRIVSMAVESTASEAVQKLAVSGKLNIDQVKKLLAGVAAVKPRAFVAETVGTGERYMVLDIIVRIAHGKLNMDTEDVALRDRPDLTERFQSMCSEDIDWNYVLREINKLYDLQTLNMRGAGKKAFGDELEKCKQEAAKQPADKAVNGIDPKTLWTTACVAALLVPDLVRAEVLNHRIRVKRNLTKVALALAAYKLTEGKYPNKLDSLVPKYIKKLPTDYFADGKPFVYRFTDKGQEYILYSIGDNLGDNGGKPGEGDIVVRSKEPKDPKKDREDF